MPSAATPRPLVERVHLDHAATTAVRPSALAALAEAAALPGNPASLHASG
ncbi:cysteine desulfurase NifS, partial [Micrococcus sp. HG099]|nr:cysteine desulfurase NifS [Micrococcus sp. HG099]